MAFLFVLLRWDRAGLLKYERNKKVRGCVDREFMIFVYLQMIIFQYIISKDAFEKYYSNLYAKRLIENLSMSDDAEISMIGKLKV